MAKYQGKTVKLGKPFRTPSQSKKFAVLSRPDGSVFKFEEDQKISTEVSNKPLSDEKIADVLSCQGIEVARRTVAKYRDMLSIPSSAERKRRSKLNKLLSTG